MIKKLLIALLMGALPVCCFAKDDLGLPTGPKQLHFLENKGQVTDQHHNSRNDIQFTVKGNGISVFIGNGQVHYQFYNALNAKPEFAKKPSMQNVGKENELTQYSMYRMDVELIGANANAQVIKEDKQEFTEHYYTIDGQRHAATDKRNGKQAATKQGLEVSSYDKITYKNIYNNIDWVIYIKNGQVEYEFVVRPGGNPSDIKMKYSGASDLKKNENGSFTATTPMGTITEAAPYSYQQDGKTVNSSFKLTNNVLSFNVDNYTGTLVIDPTLIWGTYFGSTGSEEYNSVSYDGTGNVYACGSTNSPSNMATVGAYQTTLGGGDDIFVSKFSVAGALVWSSYLGGLATDVGNSIAYNSFTTSVFISGYTNVLGDNDIYLCEFSAIGAFVWDDLFGDLGNDIGTFVECDAAGNQYICGYTNSTTGIATVGTIQTTNFGGYDGFISKYDAIGNLLWSTFYGGPSDDLLTAVNVDGSGNVYGTGTTASTTSIATLNTFAGGTYDAFATQINGTGTLWNWGRYYGGISNEECFAADVDASGSIYMTGYTTTASGMATNGAFQTTSGGGTDDAFIAKLSSAGAMVWSSYYGGNGSDQGYAITINSSNLFLGGYTSSSNLNTTGGYQTTFGGTGDGFLAKVTPAGVFGWGSFYGGSGDDAVNGIVTDNVNAIFCAGITASGTGISLNTSVQPLISSGFDGFISRFNDCVLPAQPSTITGSATVCAGSTQTYSVTAVTGLTYTWSLPIGWTGSSTTNSITVTAGTTGGTISVIANNTCGPSPAQTLNVTVNPLPTATITPAGPTTFCQGSSVVLNANTGTGLTYQWYNTSGPITGQTSNNYVATTSGTYTVQVTSNGCSTTSSGVTVTVNPTPATPTVTVNSPVCVGAATNFTASSTTSGVTYDWTGPNNFPNTQNPTIANTQASDAGSYTCIVTANGCPSAAASVTLVVVTAAPATPSAITGPASICPNTTNTYSVTNDVNASQYNWSLPTGWTGTSTTNSISATANTAGGTISVTAQNGCGTSSPSTLNVTVNALPTPTIVQSGGFLTTTSTYTTYQWYNSSGPIAGATSQNYTPTTNGTYYVIVTDGNGCSGQSNNLTFSLGVNGFNNAGNVNLYPNPNNGSFTIEGSFVANDGKVNVEIVDVAGRIVHKQQISISKNTLSVRIDMDASLAPGIYTLKLSSDAQNSVVPFVKK